MRRKTSEVGRREYFLARIMLCSDPPDAHLDYIGLEDLHNAIFIRAEVAESPWSLGDIGPDAR